MLAPPDSAKEVGIPLRLAHPRLEPTVTIYVSALIPRLVTVNVYTTVLLGRVAALPGAVTATS